MHGALTEGLKHEEGAREAAAGSAGAAGRVDPAKPKGERADGSKLTLVPLRAAPFILHTHPPLLLAALPTLQRPHPVPAPMYRHPPSCHRGASRHPRRCVCVEQRGGQRGWSGEGRVGGWLLIIVYEPAVHSMHPSPLSLPLGCDVECPPHEAPSPPSLSPSPSLLYEAPPPPPLSPPPPAGPGCTAPSSDAGVRPDDAAQCGAAGATLKQVRGRITAKEGLTSE